MSWLTSIWSEVIGLFVDDGSFAVAILIWLGACGLVLPRVGVPPALAPVILFAGLVVVLAISAITRSGERP